MRYKSGAAFRQALGSRLKSISMESGVPLNRLRKLIAFDRFLARLVLSQPDDWVLKGGFALQLRLGGRARTTKDIDLLVRKQGTDIHTALHAAGLLDIGDHFSFEVAPSTVFAVEGLGVVRFNIRTLLANYTFESFHIDVGIGDPVIGEIEYLETTSLLAFADLEPTRVPCYPVSQQIAEKLHAYTRPRKSGSSSRVKDFVDILLLAEAVEIDSVELIKAITATFKSTGTHEIPEVIPPPPRNWLQPYLRMSESVGLVGVSLDEAFVLVQNFLNPILEGEIQKGKWKPPKWE